MKASGAAVLKAENLGLSYSSARVLHDVSLDLLPGQQTAVIGRSGSGKTGLARLLAGLPPPGSTACGTLRFPGGQIDLGSMTPAQRRRSGLPIAWLPQDAQAALNPFLRLGSQLEESLRAAGMPNGSDERMASFAAVGLERILLHRYPHQLSGGQAQRAALACLLAQRPKVLVADEPTSALDPETAKGILELLRTMARQAGLSLVLVTHDLDAAAACDRVLVLDRGMVVASGAPDAVFTDPASEGTALARAAQRLADRHLSPSCSAPAP